MNDVNIIKIYEIKKKGDIVVIYMEFAEGGTLTSLLKDGAIPESRAKELFRKISMGLAYMHDRKVAHRDLKLENILLDSDGNPKLTDFSYAIVCTKEDGSPLLSRTFCGTLPYLAPGEFVILIQSSLIRLYDDAIVFVLIWVRNAAREGVRSARRGHLESRRLSVRRGKQWAAVQFERSDCDDD